MTLAGSVPSSARRRRGSSSGLNERSPNEELEPQDQPREEGQERPYRDEDPPTDDHPSHSAQHDPDGPPDDRSLSPPIVRVPGEHQDEEPGDHRNDPIGKCAGIIPGPAAELPRPETEEDPKDPS